MIGCKLFQGANESHDDAYHIRDWHRYRGCFPNLVGLYLDVKSKYAYFRSTAPVLAALPRIRISAAYCSALTGRGFVGTNFREYIFAVDHGAAPRFETPLIGA